MIIYKATNKINGKIYIGQTTGTLEQRKCGHFKRAKYGSSSYFHNAIRKYGVSNFKWEVLRICFNIKGLNAWEQYYIFYYDSMNNGYNLTTGGENYTVSDKTKQKMSESAKNKPPVSDETKEKIRIFNLGRKHTEETKKKIGLAQKGKFVSKITKEKMSKPKSDKTKQKMRQSWLNRSPMSDETKEKLRQSHLGNHHSPETREKIGQAHLGKKHSIETREKMRKARLDKNNPNYKHGKYCK